jgi:hypothetical protein
MENNKVYKCNWCDNKATKIDYRTIDGITSKIVSCDVCFNISTKKLLNNLKKDLHKS